MKVKDFQFPKYFLLYEAGLDDSIVADLLERTVEIHFTGEADTLIDRGNKLVYYNPSSVTKFIFGILYKLLATQSGSPIIKDKLALGLFQMCKEYVYADFEPEEFEGPPAIISLNKLAIPSVIIHELIEPLTGNVKDTLLFFNECNFTDACRVIRGVDQLQRQYNLKKLPVGPDDFPMVLVNCGIHNSAAELAHLTVKYLELGIGEKKAQKAFRALLLDTDSGLLDSLVLTLRTLKGDPLFVSDFLRYLQAGTRLDGEERTLTAGLQQQAIESDSYLQSIIKTAADSYTPQVFRQWSQWSMLMGLIEKQLAPMRGSMWPTSKALKPYEDELRKMMVDNASKKNKRQLNFEEMLETVRDLYDHKAVEPGKLVEVVMKDERAWKD